MAIDSDDEEQQNSLFQSTLQQSDSCSASTGEESDGSSMKVINVKINQTNSLFFSSASQLPTHDRNRLLFRICCQLLAISIFYSETNILRKLLKTSIAFAVWLIIKCFSLKM